MACDIIIPAWNKLDETRECLESIFARTGYPYRVILIDNASDRPAAEYFERLSREREDLVLLRNEENLGFIKAVNRGMSRSDADHLCILNNDTVVTAGWLAAMINVVGEDPSVAIVNPSSNNLGQWPDKDEGIDDFAAGLAGKESGWMELGAAIGFCMLLSRETKERFGLFDEIYGMGNFEDTDYSRRVQQAGLKCVRAKGAYVFHKEGVSFKRGKKHDLLFAKNRDIFHERWGRPKRVLYVLTRDEGREAALRIKDDALKLAGMGNWVWFFIKSSLKWDMETHSNIRVVRLSGRFFEANSIFRILKRKKKFDTIYVDDMESAGLIKRFKAIHKAEVECL